MDPRLLVALAVLCAALVAALAWTLVAVLASRRRVAEELASAREELAAVRRRVESLSRRVEAQADGSEAGFVITTARPSGVPPTGRAVAVQEHAPPMGSREFATAALGESLVSVVSFGHGLRRALSAENRNRIGFEVRREVRRARKQRRRETKEARRTLRATQRSHVGEDAA